MKLPLLVFIGLVSSIHAILSKDAIHDAHTYSIKNGFAGDSFVEEIKESSFGAQHGFDLDPEIEVISDDGDYVYKDFNGDTERYEYEDDDFDELDGYEDVVPEEVRLSGQSVETEDVSEYKDDKDGSDNTDDEKESTRELRGNYQREKGQSQSEEFGEETVTELEDITVKGQSEYSYLVGDKLDGLNEMRAVGAMDGGRMVLFDTEHHQQAEGLNYGIEQEQDISHSRAYEEGDTEGDMEDPNYGYHYGYDQMDKATIKGQAVERETYDDLEYDDYDYGDKTVKAARYEDEDWDDEDDDDFYDDDEIDDEVRSADLDEEDEYEYDEFEEEDEEYSLRQAEETRDVGPRVQGMSVKEEDDHGEDFEDNYDGLEDEFAEDMDKTERQDAEDFDYEDGEYDDEYIDDAERLKEHGFDDTEDEEDWDEDEYEDDLDPALRSTDEASLDTKEFDAGNMHGDASKTESTSRKSK